MTNRTVLIAPDKFKGSLTAADVVAAVRQGLQAVSPVSVRGVPVADGGDGTIAAAVAAGYVEVPVVAAGPTGEPVSTRYARLGETAVVEMADVSGLVCLPGGLLEPLVATSRGTGEVMAAAIKAGCTTLVVGIGGSASTDGGAGLISALGVNLIDAKGRHIPDGGAALDGLDRLDTGALEERLAGVSITIACDVDNPLTGPNGAAAIYGPQKGADEAQIGQLDRALGHFADVVAAHTGRDERDAPGAGAAGGVGYAALALLGATLRPGIDLIFDLIGFDKALDGVDLVITGEGSLDEQTLNGKAPAGVASASGKRGIPVLAVCGRTTLTRERLAAAGIQAAYALSDLEPDLDRSMSQAGALLTQVGQRIAREHLEPGPNDDDIGAREATMNSPDVTAFNELPNNEVREKLRRCLNVPRWVDSVAAARPYEYWPTLERTAREAAEHLDDGELLAALAGHPRIGEQASDPDHDEQLSRREQGGVDPADHDTAARLRTGNLAYEARFNRVFLIRAAGRSAEEILAELDRRRNNDEVTERAETVTQLRDIAILRLKETL